MRSFSGGNKPCHGVDTETQPCFQGISFTNAGATGQAGPTQSDVNSAYVGTSAEGLVTVSTQGIQEWTVPANGNFLIEAWGAQGGAAKGTAGGKGAFISGKGFLTHRFKLR